MKTKTLLIDGKKVRCQSLGPKAIIQVGDSYDDGSYYREGDFHLGQSTDSRGAYSISPHYNLYRPIKPKPRAKLPAKPKKVERVKARAHLDACGEITLSALYYQQVDITYIPVWITPRGKGEN